MYDGISEASWADVLVGYTTSAFVLADNKVSAALVQEPVEVTAIRVLIQTSSYGGYYHDTLECGSENGFYVSDGQGKTEWMEGGKRIEITPELVREYGGRIYLGTDSEEGRIVLHNVRRAAGSPSYRGTLEIALSEEKLLVVNELPLEEYLYGVLPSEMPESFGAEALKAQAVCARSYACNQLLANRYSAYGAHVDDSMNCQVYQNYGETEASVEAVKATFGRVLSREESALPPIIFPAPTGIPPIAMQCGEMIQEQDFRVWFRQRKAVPEIWRKIQISNSFWTVTGNGTMKNRCGFDGVRFLGQN